MSGDSPQEVPEPESDMAGHPNIEQIRRFLESRETREGRSTSRHLLRCEQCRDRTAREVHKSEGQAEWLAKVLPYPLRKPGPGADTGRLLGVLSAAAREVRASGELLEELRRQPLERWRLLFDNSSHFHSLAVAREIVRVGHREGFEDPNRGALVVLRGIELVDRLDPETYGQRLLDDTRGRGWASIGDCYRMAGDLKAADGAFRCAKRLLRETTDPEELATRDYLLGVLRKDQRKFDEALRLFERAHRLSEEIGDSQRVVRILTSLGILHMEKGEPEEALPSLLDASMLVETYGDRRLRLFVQTNLVSCLVDLGDCAGARELYEQLAESGAEAPDSFLRLRWRWLEGRIAAGLGEDDGAERALDAVRAKYRERGQQYNVAQVSLHLAVIYARQGRTAELKSLAEEMTAVFVAQDVPAEAIAALSFLRRAIEQERATEELVGNVVRFVERAVNHPSAKFRAGER